MNHCLLLPECFGNFQKTLLKCSYWCDVILIDVSHNIQVFRSFIWITSKVQKKWAYFIISLAQLLIGLSESWKLCLNLCLRRWPKPILNLVHNVIRFGLWQLKTSLPEGHNELQKIFSEDIQTLRILNTLVQFIPFQNRRRENEF